MRRESSVQCSNGPSIRSGWQVFSAEAPGILPATPRWTKVCQDLARGVMAVFGMRVSVVLSGFCGVVGGVMQMALRNVRMVRGGVRVAGFMARGGFPMMTCGVLMMLGGLAMMLGV